ncbi:MAG: alpha-amylase family glycosyl hydrolase, partial [Verrucomicrobium sp.]|nr:alpha-amylase family glycosyl hydrolase [Verrucomicrobium sp.]
MNTPRGCTGELFLSDCDFRGEIIYFIFVDRFHAGHPREVEGDPLADPTRKDWDKYWGGDLRGVINKLDYLEQTGVTALWITPVFEQVEGLEAGTDRAPIHGYWLKDFKRLNKRWVDAPEEASIFQSSKPTVFDELVAEVHRRDMKLILDVVCNHSSPATSEGKGRVYDDGKLVADFNDDKNGWYYHYGEVQDWDNEWQVQHCEVAGLATFNEGNKQVRDYLKNSIKSWLDRGVDALRLDTVKHLPLWFWQEFTTDMHSHNPEVFLFGEWINNHPQNPKSLEYANKCGMSLLDFGICHGIRMALGHRCPEGFELLNEIMEADQQYRG